MTGFRFQPQPKHLTHQILNREILFCQTGGLVYKNLCRPSRYQPIYISVLVFVPAI